MIPIHASLGFMAKYWFLIHAEAALNLGSCPQPPCKTDALVWSWTAVAGLAPALVLPGEVVKGACPVMPIYTAGKVQSECSVLGGRGEDIYALHTSWSKAQDSRAKHYKKRLCNILINLLQSWTNTSTASVGLQRPGWGVNTIQASVTTQIPCTLLVQQLSNRPQLKNPFSLFKTTRMF